MKRALHAPCSECGGSVRTRKIKQEFEREGIRVSVAGVRALVCSRCGEVYFPPGGAQALVEAANGLFALARRNRQSRGRLSAAVS
jgi:YgiT-type zinc finger domain-containing protein